MEVQFVCPEGSDLTQLREEYDDLDHDYTFDGYEIWWIGKSGEEYWDPQRNLFDYSDDAEDFSAERDTDKEWMTEEECVEFCGFAETLVPGSSTLLEGNGEWAQGQLRKEEAYQTGVAEAQALLQKH